MANRKIEIPIGLVAADYMSGMSLRSLGGKYNTSFKVIYERLVEYGVNTRKISREIDREWLRHLYKRHSLKEMSEILMIPRSSVYYLLKKNNIKTKRNVPPNIKHWRILYMWEQTHNKTYIANIVGVSLGMVYRVIQANERNKGAN